LNPTLGSAGYALNLRGAKALLSRLSILDWPTDHLLVGYEGYNATFGEIRPLLVQQASVVSNIEIDRRKEWNQSKADTSMINRLRRRAGWLGRALHRPIVMARNVLIAKVGRGFRRTPARAL
jgi:GR25 family glycosyltransferase involved in LPS biosynthesis